MAGALMGEFTNFVREFFAQFRYAGLKLPDGWFGRPYDNLYHLSSVKLVEGDVLLIEFDGQMLALHRPTDVTADEGVLRISGFTHGSWEWIEHGADVTHQKTFEGGAVELIVPPPI